MTFARIAMISLLFHKGLINCQLNTREVEFKHFFEYKIKVDYNTCKHSFYEEDYQSDNEDEEYQHEYNYGDEYDNDQCIR